MTTIAYRDGVLAADSQVTHDDVITGTARKIHALPNGDWVALLGARGEAETLMRWYADRRELEEGQPATSNCAIVVVHPSGAVSLYEDGHYQPVSEAPFWAWGTGAELALGAMIAGASAEEAVAAAITRDVYSGAPVYALRREQSDG